MSHIKIICGSMWKHGASCLCGCGECKTSCQSASKTDVAILSQDCENFDRFDDSDASEDSADGSSEETE
jgi:hypothetical protein